MTEFRAKAGEGAGVAWLRHHVNYDADFCLIFPFYRDPNGYGRFGYHGKQLYAHRFMCELANGPPPGKGYEAAHECGNGEGGCANPRHLKWKTKVGNRQDSLRHGTGVRSYGGNVRSLNEDQVNQIRALKGHKTQVEIAAMFGISAPTVRMIFVGKMYAGKSKINHWTEAEDAKIREAVALGYSFPQMSRHVGRSVGAVMGRTYRLGLSSGRPPTRSDYSSVRKSL